MEKELNKVHNWNMQDDKDIEESQDVVESYTHPQPQNIPPSIHFYLSSLIWSVVSVKQ